MKIEIFAKRERESHEDAERLIHRACGHLPAHWVKILPDIEVHILGKSGMSRAAFRRWNSGRAASKAPDNGWCVQVVDVPHSLPPPPCRIEICYRIKPGDPRGKAKEYLLVKSLVSAFLYCSFRQKKVSQMVSLTARQFDLLERYQPDALLIDEIPIFIVNATMALSTIPNLAHFFIALDAKIRDLNIEKEADLREGYTGP